MREVPRTWIIAVQEPNIDSRVSVEVTLWSDAKAVHFRGDDTDGRMRAQVGEWLTELLRRHGVPDAGS